MKPILSEFGLVTVGDEQAFAVTTVDDKYRYVLGRTWDSSLPVWCFCMLNPSTARGAIVVDGVRKVVDDATIRKCCGFARRGGAGGIVVVNTMAYSETHPNELLKTFYFGDVDVVGDHNAAAFEWATSLSERNIAAWGVIAPKLQAASKPGIDAFLCATTAECLCVVVECFGVNDSDASPRHPLMLAYDTPIVKLTDAREALREGFHNGIRAARGP
jgi:hypothetical protein